MFLGGLLAGVPVLAVVAIAALGVGAAALAARFRLGTIAMTLCLPMFGVGLSYSDIDKAAGLAGLMVLGSVFACAVSMLWPERPPPARRSPPPPAAKPTLGYGLRLGAAGATAAAIGFIADLEHVGWASCVPAPRCSGSAAPAGSSPSLPAPWLEQRSSGYTRPRRCTAWRSSR